MLHIPSSAKLKTHCSNYKAEGEAIIHAAHTVLQALMNDNIPQVEQALYTIKTLRTVLQWIPSHCGVHGNEQADRLLPHRDKDHHKISIQDSSATRQLPPADKI